ncbi:hypothetical protein B0H11DRAFT_2024618 [Mycena galericulata]|nr:hypothetical protein B0H11DRAFT_2024618 [Mycena galericulata]
MRNKDVGGGLSVDGPHVTGGAGRRGSDVGTDDTEFEVLRPDASHKVHGQPRQGTQAEQDEVVVDEARACVIVFIAILFDASRGRRRVFRIWGSRRLQFVFACASHIIYAVFLLRIVVAAVAVAFTRIVRSWVFSTVDRVFAMRERRRWRRWRSRGRGTVMAQAAALVNQSTSNERNERKQPGNDQNHTQERGCILRKNNASRGARYVRGG